MAGINCLNRIIFEKFVESVQDLTRLTVTELGRLAWLRTAHSSVWMGMENYEHLFFRLRECCSHRPPPDHSSNSTSTTVSRVRSFSSHAGAAQGFLGFWFVRIVGCDGWWMVGGWLVEIWILSRLCQARHGQSWVLPTHMLQPVVTSQLQIWGPLHHTWPGHTPGTRTEGDKVRLSGDHHK